MRAHRSLLSSLALAAIGVFLAGCIEREASSPDDVDVWVPESSALDTFALRRGGPSPILLQVRADGVYGPDVSVGRYLEGDHIALRGRVGREIVDLEVHDGRVLGLLGAGRIDLRVQRQGVNVFADGLVRSQLSNFQLTPAGLQGTIGRCSYDLVSTEVGSASGRSSCGLAISATTVELPATLRSLSDAEKVAILAIFTS